MGIVKPHHILEKRESWYTLSFSIIPVGNPTVGQTQFVPIREICGKSSFKILNKPTIMQPKTINILYWVFTILFAALMIFSSYGSILVNEDAKNLIHDQLGYPVYFIPFTG